MDTAADIARIAESVEAIEWMLSCLFWAICFGATIKTIKAVFGGDQS